MKKQATRYLVKGISFLILFALWTIAVRLVDVQPIGPQGSEVGFAALNGWFHNLTGVHMQLYVITDWLSLVPLAVVVIFGLLGLFQWIKRKSILKVDGSILALGIFYVATMGAFLLFEKVVVNFRPVLIDGVLEASYPSSTTLLVMCVMPAAMMQLCDRMKNQVLRRWLFILIGAFTAFMVLGRVLSGVHWLTDIVGGMLLSGGLIMMYQFLQNFLGGYTHE